MTVEGSIIQVAYLVRDLEAAMQRHWEVCGQGPWDVYEFDATKVDDFIYRGRPATHKALLGLTWKGAVQIELIQPVSGYSIYDEHIEKHGEGLHHVKFYHADCQKAVAHYTAQGYPVIQSGRFNQDEHYYLDTEKDFGYVIELGNVGRVPPPNRRYPA
ncbi:VOC family protein [Geminicoccus flavidas]|uniref:VOC family protein n=1 Tax=Geminicoccus flavidas TaxID=2506407 RepID=UPI00135AB2A1|nr:VOC family protein [Geminicoccus flavidas]